MSRRLRFTAWVVVALVLSVGQCGWLLADHERHWPAVAAFELAALAMLALILTTPADAIRLKRPHGECLIVAGTLALQVAAGGRGGYALVIVLACTFLLALTRVAGRSPWWVVPLAWNPLLLAILPA